MTSVVCFGEIVSDLIVYTESDAATAAPTFQRIDASPGEWLELLAEYTANRRFAVHGGGSIANVAAALTRVLGRSHQVFFSVAEQPRNSRLAPPLWWVGVEPSRRDLMGLAVRVRGGDQAPVFPTSPGAVAFVDRSGTVSKLVAVRQDACEIREIPGDWLVARSDHLAGLRPEYVAAFGCVAVLLADDRAGWPEVELLARAGRPMWLFGAKRTAASFTASVDALSVGWVLTDGPDACEVRRQGSDKRSSLPVEPVEGAGNDLGAGDAYMGGFLGSVLSGGDALSGHEAGCRAAASALDAEGARTPADVDLNRVFPNIERSSPGTAEGLVLDEILASPGITLVSGGQTGVDSFVGAAVTAVGLPVHYVFPAGFRTELGALGEADRRHLGRARFHQLGSESFRYRTWATLYFADAVLVLNYASGDGTAEAIRAAAYFGKPRLDLTDDDRNATEVASWLLDHDVRVAAIAGNRASLLTEATRDRALRQARKVALAMCEVNRALLGSRQLPDLQGRGIGVPRRVLDSPFGTAMVRSGLDEPSAVTLKPRDLAAALEHGRLQAAITWPSLLSPASRSECTVEPLGAFSVHYGLAVRSRGVAIRSIADQYPAAFESTVAGTTLEDAERIPIVGDAETWLARGLVDAAYDTYRTGETLASRGLGPFYPSHWETLALVRRSDHRHVLPREPVTFGA